MKHPSLKHWASVALCVVLVVVAFLSTLFLAHEANHHCQNPDCAICLQLHAAKRFINSISGGTMAGVGVALLLAWVCLVGLWISNPPPCGTLVTAKIRMNN